MAPMLRRRTVVVLKTCPCGLKVLDRKVAGSASTIHYLMVAKVCDKTFNELLAVPTILLIKNQIGNLGTIRLEQAKLNMRALCLMFYKGPI